MSGDKTVSLSTRTSTTTKRKRKSAPDDDASEVAVERIVDEPAIDRISDALQNAKKKRKKKNTGDDGAHSNAVDARVNVDEGENGRERGTESGSGGADVGVPAPSKKKSKKKQDKGKGKEVAAQGIAIDPSLSGATDNTAQLSTVIAAAAASTTANLNSGAPAQGQLPYFTPYTFTTAPADQPPFNLSPAAFSQPGQNQIPTFLTDGSVPIADPNFSGLQNNEEVLRALQELDVTKLADVIRSFGQQAQANGAQPLGPAPDGALPASQIPAPTAFILGQPLRNPPKQPTSTGVTMPMVGMEENLEHAQMLCTKWLTPTKLAELVKTKGLVYKKGKFSATEEQQVKQAIEEYQRQHDLTAEQIREKIYAKGIKDRDNAFWSEITSHVPQRPIIAIYHYVRRSYHPLKQQGKWSVTEDETLRAAVIELGQAWEKVSAYVGRMASDCRDRWRNHINHAETRTTGPWTKEEEELLTKIVTEMTTDQGKDPDNDVFWTQVAAKMGNTRGRQQCRIKWTDALSKLVKNAGSRPRWSQQDAYILVHKIASLNVRDDSEIDWKLLNDEDWNLWSAHCLQRRWIALKHSVKGYEEMSHLEIMDILRIKKSSFPENPAPPRRSRVTSAAHIPVDVQRAEDEQAQSQTNGFVGHPEAGPSHMHFGDPHAGVVYAQPDMDFGGPGPSSILDATQAFHAPPSGPAGPSTSIQEDQVTEDAASDLFGTVVPPPEEHEVDPTSSNSSDSSEVSSDSSSEVSSDEESSDSDSDSD